MFYYPVRITTCTSEGRRWRGPSVDSWIKEGLDSNGGLDAAVRDSSVEDGKHLGTVDILLGGKGVGVEEYIVYLEFLTHYYRYMS